MLAGFLVAWAASSAVMMLPSALPFVRTVASGGVRAMSVVGGYLAVWFAAGAAAYYGMMLADASSLGPGVGLAAAGAYQLSPLKHACLRRCRSPFHFLLHRRHGLLIGFEYGATCLACCAGLMAALLVLGMSSYFWMAAVAIVIAGEKLLGFGPRIALAAAASLLAAGAWRIAT
jgi:predicted metal-binding membrane protein